MRTTGGRRTRVDRPVRRPCGLAVDEPRPPYDGAVPDVGVVITAFDQGSLVLEAVASVRRQTHPVADVVVVDDGSREPASVTALERLAEDDGVRVLRRTNGGVSAARNTGLAALSTELAVVLDGDDRLAPTFVERTAAVLAADPEVVAASSWLQMHGVASAVARPAGGRAVDFLHRNACPATVLLRRDAWRRAGGYDEDLRSGFEDWDLFLAVLAEGGRVAVVPEPLVEYRTSPTSANVRSMERRLELYGRLVDKHRPLFERHLREVLLAHEAASPQRLLAWEALRAGDDAPLVEASFGDGGMAAVVRLASRRAAQAPSPAPTSDRPAPRSPAPGA